MQTDVLGISDVLMTSERFAPLCKPSMFPSYLSRAVLGLFCSHLCARIVCLCFRFAFALYAPRLCSSRLWLGGFRSPSASS
jgi:hypothetical protein